MTIMYSTGLRTGLCGTTGIKGAGMLDAFFIDIYSGSQPVDADQAPSGTLLATISESADGITPLTFGTPADGRVGKTPGELWRGNGLANGTAGWYRLRRAGDAGGVSTSAVRMDGSIATIGGNMRLGSTAVEVGVPVDINVYNITFGKIGVTL